MRRSSDFNAPRRWLEENPVTREEFVKLFNAGLNRATGDEYQREGLFLPPHRGGGAPPKRRLFVPYFTREEAHAHRRRFYYPTDKRGRVHKVHVRTGRYARFTKHDQSVKKSRPSHVKTPGVE